jgi:hypothetical protein
MHETGVVLYMLGSVKVLVDRGDERKHRGARVKRTAVTAGATSSPYRAPLTSAVS